MNVFEIRNCLVALFLVMSGCGGSGSSSIDGLGPIGQTSSELCENNYYRTIIGHYKGSAQFKVRAEDGSEVAACTWTITMDIRHEGSPVVCDLVAELDAPVEQAIVLDSSDPDAFQCFPDTSLRQVNDVNSTIDPDEFENLTFPISLRVFEDFSANPNGPYFGNEFVIAQYHRILDFGWIKRFVFDGSGFIELRTSSGGSFPFFGHLEKIK